MFCSGCGAQLQEGTAFCSGCGTKNGGGGVAIATQQASTTMVRDFRCNGCGTPLKIPTNSNAPVRCPSCKTECLIERAIKNAEIAAKENIESGVPLTATPAKLHSRVVAVLGKSPNIPLDVFEKVEVIREEHYCIPAYFFSCNGTASFTYDVCNIRQQTVVRDNGEKSWEETRTREEWDNGKSSSASVFKPIVVSGNRNLVKQVQSLYSNIDTKKLVDIEELIYPTDVDTAKGDVPQTMGYNEFAVPIVEKALKEKATESLSKQKTRDLQMGGASIQKDVVRIFLGMYRIVFKYGDKEYSVWVSGDGSNWWWNEGIPEDAQRKSSLESMNKAKEQATASIETPKTGALTFFFWAGILGALFTLGISLIITIICGVIRSKKRKEYASQQSDVNEKFQSEIDAFEGQAKNVVQQFKNQKKALRGIYEGVSGDEKAF